MERMELIFLGLEYLSMLLSVVSIAIAITALYLAYRCVNAIKIVKLSNRGIYGSRRYRRVKRYILFRFVCFDETYIHEFSKKFTSHIYAFLGPLIKARCSISIITIRSDLGRGIIRVSGDSECVKYVLTAMSLRHIVDNIPCLVIPLRTSGLVSRLRRYLRT